MANALTGDFEALLQVSGGTINRLLASMHQNAGAKPTLPSFPHNVLLRLGDDGPIDGIRGTMRAQVAVPRVQLMHGVTDRFLLEVGIRARFKPDAGTKPLPEFIHGTVHAEYRLHDIDPNCFGWSQIAASHLWIRVVKDSVKFTGTAFDDRSPFEAAQLVNDDEINARITRQIAALLASQFEATPHPVSPRFRRGALRSLAPAGGGSGVVIPLALSGEPVGAITRVNDLLLEGADFAIAVQRDYIMSLAGPALASIGSFTRTIPIHIGTPWPLPDVDTVYRVRVNPPSAEWQAHGSFAVIRIKCSGSATTDSILADATFDVQQDITLNFGAGSEALWLAAGSSSVKVHSSGLGHSEVGDVVKKGVSGALTPMIANACAQAQPGLAAMISRKQELVDQLRTVDDQAGARVDEAVFLPDGVILRGTIPLSLRQTPVVSFDETLEEDGYTGFDCWLPGGRIDSFVWSWSWFTGRVPGAATHTDRFLLRRPRGTPSRWGGLRVSLGETTPLPGLDGMGVVCLKIRGVQVDAATGNLIPVESRRQCARFGQSIYISPGGGRLFWRIFPDEPELSQRVPFPELALMEVGGKQSPEAIAANTLLVYVDRKWDRDTALALRGGLEASRRQDAGLSVVVLFREGALGEERESIFAELEELSAEIGAPVVLNEDVHGAWSSALALPGGRAKQAWRLIAPGGGVIWMHDGRLPAERLGVALDQHLIPSAPPRPELMRPRADLGARVTASALHPGYFESRPESPCPPPPLGRVGRRDVIVAFVQAGSASSTAQLRELSAQHDREEKDRPVVVAVVDGATPREAEALKNELGIDFAAVADSRGLIAERFGVRFWPTTVTINHAGRVSEVEMGYMPQRAEREEGERDASRGRDEGRKCD